MSAKFTPGPWIVVAQEPDVSYIQVLGTSLGHKYMIANCPFNPPGDSAEALANAHLIAAAPELYEAGDPDLLQEALDELDGFKSSMRGSDREHMELAELIARLDAKRMREVAALAKARGDQ